MRAGGSSELSPIAKPLQAVQGWRVLAVWGEGQSSAIALAPRLAMRSFRGCKLGISAASLGQKGAFV